MTGDLGIDGNLATSGGIAALAVLGAVANGDKWRDPKSGTINPSLLVSGIATSLILATAVRAAGVHFGVEPWAQVAASGVLCYVGPDPILKALAGMALKRFGVVDGTKQDSSKP